MEVDKPATGQAVALVIFVSVGIGVGPDGGIPGLLASTSLAFAGLVIFAAIVYFVGATILPEKSPEADWG